MDYPFSIPYTDFAGSGPALHFLHANGYPSEAYRLLLGRLASQYHVFAMRMRPQWPIDHPAANPSNLPNWQPLADDLESFLTQQNLDNLIGIGHSVGATTTLRLALQRPSRFQALALIDPVLFPPGTIILWNLLHRLNLALHFHPLAQSTLHRRASFESRRAMFDNYRQKAIFQRISDDGLWAYVDSLACPQPDGSIQLCYSREWEAHIYLTGVLCDLSLWRSLSTLKPRLLLLSGEHSNTFQASTARLIQHRLPAAQIVTVPGATHLLPLEQPEMIADIILKFLSNQPSMPSLLPNP